MKSVIAIGCLAGLVLLALGIALWTVIIMLVWNFLLVPAFHLSTLDWGQAIAVAIVLSLIQSALTGGRTSAR